MKSFARFIRSLVSSRLGLILLAMHFIIVTFEFARKIPEYNDTSWTEFQKMGWDYSLIAARGFHWHYESVMLKIITVLDLPAILVGSLVSDVFFTGLYSKLTADTASWIDAGILLFFTSRIQQRSATGCELKNT